MLSYPTGRLGVTAAAFMLISGIVFFGTSTHAGAYCDYPYAAVSLFQNWGRESTPNVNTCDGDQVYKGKVTDLSSDGYCVVVQFKEGSQVYNQATSCSTSGVNYTFYDQNGNGWTYLKICKSGTSTCYPSGSSWAYSQSY